MISLSSGHSAEYLPGRSRQGRENYYTGAVSDGRAARPLVRARRRRARPDRAGRPPGHAGALRAVPRPARRPLPRTRSGGTRRPAWADRRRAYLSADELYSRMLDASRTRPLNAVQQLRFASVRAGSTRSPWRSSTSRSTCRSRSRSAHRVRGPGGRRPPRGRRGDRAGVGGAPAGGRGRDLGGQQRRRWPTSPSTPATPGSGTTAAPPAAGSTPTTGSSRRSSSTTPATTTRTCTSTTRCSTASRAPTGCGAPSTGAPVPLAARPRRGRGADDRGAPDPRARRAGSRCARTARPARSSASPQEAMDLFSTRRRKLTAKAEELVAAFEARYGRAPNGLELRPAAAAGHASRPGGRSRTTGETREELLDRLDRELRAEVAGGLAAVAARRARRPPAQDPRRRRGRRGR